jgi:hypothetical protein
MEYMSSREKLDKAKDKLEGRPWSVEVRGKRFTLRRKGHDCARPKYKTRGAIVSFSRRARARMLKKIAEIDWATAGQGLFFTVTYPDEVAQHTMAERSRHRYLIHRWIEKTLRCKVPCVWRVEWMPRLTGSLVGKVMPHMHLLLFTDKGLDKEELRMVWMRTIGAKRHTQIDVQRINVGDMVSVYAAKYCSKESSSLHLDNVPYRNKTGRHAGWLRVKLIPFHPLDTFYRVNDAIVLAMRARACETLWWYDPRFDEGFTILGDVAIEIIRDFYGIAIDSPVN